MYPQDNRNFVDFRTTMPAQYGNQVNSTYFPPATQQPVYPKYIPGHIVNTIAEVVPNDVPMNGSISVFPTSDGQNIFTKAWNADGTISTVRYERISEEDTPLQSPQEDSLKLIMDKLEAIESKLNYNRSRNKNEGGANGN